MCNNIDIKHRFIKNAIVQDLSKYSASAEYRYCSIK